MKTLHLLSILLLCLSSSSSSSSEVSFSIIPPKPQVFVYSKAVNKDLKLTWKLNYGNFTKDDFVYTLNHKYARVNGGEGMNMVSKEYPTECPPAGGDAFGYSECGAGRFKGRMYLYITTLPTVGYDALMVEIRNVTLADFNVDPERLPTSPSEDKMKFEVLMHSAVIAHIGKSSGSTIEVDYTTSDPNKSRDALNQDQQIVNYASVIVGVVVALIVLVILGILWAKRKTLQRLFGHPDQKPTVETVKNAPNGEADHLAKDPNV